MATQARTVAFVLEQLGGMPGVAVRPMFGEYGLSCDGKHVGVICRDRLYLKITPQARALAPGAPEEPPYTGAKPALLVEADRMDDAEWLCTLVAATAAALPMPKRRKGKRVPPPVAG